MKFQTAQKLNRIKMIHDILFNSCEIVGDIRVNIESEIEDDEEYTIDDKIMGEIVAKVEYNIETLRRYL